MASCAVRPKWSWLTIAAGMTHEEAIRCITGHSSISYTHFRRQQLKEIRSDSPRNCPPNKAPAL